MRLEPAPVVVLTGASSSGKTTLATEVQRLAPYPMVLLSGDAMDLPPDALSREHLKRLPEGDAHVWQESVFTAFYGTLALWADGGVGVIGEALFKSKQEVDICRRELAGRQFVIIPTGL